MTIQITAEMSANVSTNALHEDTLAPDTLIIDLDGYLISSAQSGAILEGNAWTVTVNGQIAGFGLYGLFMNLATQNVSTVTIGKTGDVFGATTGLLVNAAVNLTNRGTITCGSFSGHALEVNGTANITNTGLIGDRSLLNDAAVLLDNGHDIFTNFQKIGDTIKNGIVWGGIDLWGGDDIFKGGANEETVRDGGGSDSYNLGGGDDNFRAVRDPAASQGADGTDTINGGAGSDDYDASDATSSVLINLDIVSHDQGPFNPGLKLVAANTATGTDIAGGFKDTIIGFESAAGGLGADNIYGSSVANVLNGVDGNDVLFGYAGNDELFGGSGTDILTGGAGKDTLWGSPDSTLDYFAFLKISDSGTTAAARDLIEEFETGIDQIHLFHIDANTKLAGDQAFQLTARSGFGPFTKTPGELKFRFTDGGNTVVSGDVNGDGTADFSIALDGHVLLHETDFLL